MADTLKTILTRLSKYEWLNILLPGCFFELLGAKFGIELSAAHTTYSVVLSILFWGMLSSRIGATIIEWGVKKFKPFAPYGQFIEWEKSDSDKAELMVANLNMFRSLSGMALLLTTSILAKISLDWLNGLTWMRNNGLRINAGILIALCLFVLFIWSYVRQIQFIKDRVTKATQSSTKDAVQHD